MKQRTRQTVPCPECSADVRLRKVTQLGQLLTCRGCNAQLEVVNLAPLELDWATQVQFKEPVDYKRSKGKKRRRSSNVFEEQWDHY